MNDFTQYRTILGFQKSKKYLAYMKSCYPDKDLHHILGSVFNKKFTDYLVVPVDHDFHLNKVEPNKAYWFSQYLKWAVRSLVHYARQILGFSTAEIVKLLPNYEPENIKKFIEAVYELENTK
jgi:hypothetical protein